METHTSASTANANESQNSQATLSSRDGNKRGSKPHNEKKKYPSVMLQAHLCETQFKQVVSEMGTSKFLINGKKNKDHGLLVVHRQLALIDLIMSYPSIKDIQGKPRSLGLRVRRKGKVVNVEYPHHCRTTITPWDLNYLNVHNHHYSDCEEPTDFTMSVDVLQHLTPFEVAKMAMCGEQNTHFAIFTDLRETVPGKAYGVKADIVFAGREPRISKAIEGHADPTGDRVMSWLYSGSQQVCIDQGIMLSWTDWGKTWGLTKTLRFVATPILDQIHRPLPQYLEDWVVDYYLMSLPNGRYETRDGLVHVLPKVIIEQPVGPTTEDQESRVYVKSDLDAITRIIKYREMTESLEYSAHCLLRGKYGSEPSRTHPDVVARLLHAKSLADNTQDVVPVPRYGAVEDRAKVSLLWRIYTYSPSLKSFVELMKVLPKFIGWLALTGAASTVSCNSLRWVVGVVGTTAAGAILWRIYQRRQTRKPRPTKRAKPAPGLINTRRPRVVSLADAKEGLAGKLNPSGMEGYVVPEDHPIREQAEGTSVKYTGDPEAGKDKPVLFPNGIVISGYVPHVQADCVRNLLVGVKNRLTFQLPDYDPTTWEDVGSLLADLLDPTGVEWQTREDWDARYPLNKRNAHKQALEAWYRDGNVDYTRLMFLKKEKNNTQAPGWFGDCDLCTAKVADPRIILGMQTETVNTLVGPAIWSMSKHLADQWDGRGLLFYVSGSSSRRLGEWFTLAQQTEDTKIAVLGDDVIMVKGPVDSREIWVSDLSRCDRTVRPEASKVEQQVLCGMVRGSPDHPYECHLETILREAHEASVDPVCIDNTYGVVVEKIGGRCSGDQWTSVGNSIVVGGGAAYCSKAENIAEYQDLWASLGFKSKASKGGVNSGDFLSGIFVPFDGTYHWIPKPGRLLARLGVSVSKPLTPSQMRGVMTQFACYKNVPFLGPFIERMQVLLGPGKVSVMAKYKYIDHDEIIPPPAQDTWAYFRERYDLGPEDQMAWWGDLEHAHSLPWAVDSSIAVRLCSVDYP